MAERLEGQDARQGKKGKPVLYVLIGSLVLLAIAITGLMTWQGANSPKDYASQSQDASRGQVTGSVNGSGNGTSSANTGNVPAGNPAYPAPAQPSANGGQK
ncbi:MULTISPECIES: hypothetical protein [unclassified Methylobacterium]|uniref:hypothetical protein n=1 Tax=unclassified Methylobacterium TaxID=2615210 RepID=UPI00035C5F2B|nr:MULTISPECIES: hypothetical protein [unclassified Methylobacterium]KQP03399.1 hypothetical protein ASF26_13980 [Methylobacterium sp. Leaf93]